MYINSALYNIITLVTIECKLVFYSYDIGGPFDPNNLEQRFLARIGTFITLKTCLLQIIEFQDIRP